MHVPSSMNLEAGSICNAAAFDFRAFDALIYDTPGIDSFCSSSVWSESIRQGFMPDSPLIAYTYHHAVALFTVMHTPHGIRALIPLDAVWNLGSSIASSNPRRELGGLVSQIAMDLPQFHVCILSGIRAHSDFYRLLVCALSEQQLNMQRYQLTTRCVADLRDGYDAWLARRSAKFRSSIRHAICDTQQADVRIRPLRHTQMHDGLIDTLLDIESRSWKGDAQTGLTDGAMQTFCAHFIRRAAQAKQLQAQLAYHNEQPVGYIIGAVANQRYRGGFMAFDNRYRSIGLGNALQISMIQALEQNEVFSYDLGSYMPYKARWSDCEDRTETLLISSSGHGRFHSTSR